MDLETKDGDRNGWSDVPVHHGTGKRTVQYRQRFRWRYTATKRPIAAAADTLTLQSNPVNINGADLTERCSGTTRQHRWLVVEL